MSENNAIVPYGKNANLSLDQVCTLAQHAIKSGMFPDTQSVSLAVMKIMAGQEFGIGPFASLDGIRIIKGKPSLSSTMIGALMQRTGVYDYRIREHDDYHCVVEVFKHGESIGFSEFTIDHAKTAGVYSTNPTWQKYPRNMLMARAISNAARWYCPMILAGASIYIAEELSEGEILDDDNIPQIEAPKLETATPDMYMEYAKAAAFTTSDGRVFGEMDYSDLVKLDASIVKFIKNNGHDPRLQGAIDRHEAIRSLGYFGAHPEMIEVQKKLLEERNKPVEAELVEEPDTEADVPFDEKAGEGFEDD